MGWVYLAQQDLIERLVAVKVLKPELACEKAKVDQFQREAVAASRIRHPNVALIYDYGAFGDSLYIAMEYVEGESLAAALKEHGALRVEDAIEIAEQTALALEAAHAQGVLHRDIKPHNVLLGAGPSGLQVKVVDFGVAKLLDRGSSMHTAAGLVMGTPEYMSPEHACGKKPSPAVDLYSLGVVLFQMLEGRPPFVSKARFDVVEAHLHAPVPPMSARVPPSLVRLVAQLLAKKPRHRPKSAKAVVGALRRARRMWEIHCADSDMQTDCDATTINNWLTQADTVVETTEAVTQPRSVAGPPLPSPSLTTRKMDRPPGLCPGQTQAIRVAGLPRDTAIRPTHPTTTRDVGHGGGILRTLVTLALAGALGLLLVLLGIWATRLWIGVAG